MIYIFIKDYTPFAIGETLSKEDRRIGSSSDLSIPSDPESIDRHIKQMLKLRVLAVDLNETNS
jgi:hypothetical protein